MAEVDSYSYPLSLTKSNGGQTAVHVLSQDALIEQRLGEVNILENETKFETLRQRFNERVETQKQTETGTCAPRARTLK